MKLKCIFLILMVAQVCNGATFEDHVVQHYSSVVRCIEDCGIQGPIAGEIAQYALIRQVHEDGIDRKPDYSVPGIGTGGWNSDILKTTLKRLKPGVSVGHCFDSDGMKLFTLQGKGANTAAATTIAFLFDYYPSKFAFSEQQKHIWKKSLTLSYLLACNPNLEDYRAEFEALKPERDKILRRCNQMYGPGSDRIEGTVKRLQQLFDQQKGLANGG